MHPFTILKAQILLDATPQEINSEKISYKTGSSSIAFLFTRKKGKSISTKHAYTFFTSLIKEIKDLKTKFDTYAI